MTGDSLELIRLRNNFYRDNYRRVMKLLLLLALVLVVALGTIFYLLSHRPSPQYFATTESGQVLNLIPLSAPMYNSTSLLSWAVDTATRAYNFSFVDYRAKLQSLQPRFTRDAWSQFLEAQKVNLKAVAGNQMIVSAVVSGPAVILHEGLLPDGSYAWRVQMRILTTIETASDTAQSGHLVSMLIKRVSTLEDPHGIAVAQFVGK